MYDATHTTHTAPHQTTHINLRPPKTVHYVFCVCGKVSVSLFKGVLTHVSCTSLCVLADVCVDSCVYKFVCVVCVHVCVCVGRCVCAS